MIKRKARISKKKINSLLINFLHGSTAREAARNTDINRNTANSWYKHFREKIWEHCLQNKPRFSGEVEVDQSQFGHWYMGRVQEATKVIGILNRKTKEIYTCPIKDQTKETLWKVITEIVEPGSTIITDSWSSYNGIESMGYKHIKVNHSREEWTDGKGNHTATVDAFFNTSDKRLGRYNGYRRYYFPLYLKECECLWNIAKLAEKVGSRQSNKNFEARMEMIKKIVGIN